jgi:hypothetical protein
MRHIRFRELLLAAAVLLGTSASIEAGVLNFCPAGGPCNFTDATIVNVYWDVSPASWDADVGGAGSGLTQAQIDAFTAAIIHSTYFSQLKQYGVNSITFAPSVTTGSCGTVPANVDDAMNNIDGLILCALTHAQVAASPQTIINVFLPPRVINTGFCNADASGAHATAMHSVSPNFASPLYTIIPTTAACTGGMVFSAETHEMVEALTDPDAWGISGWKVFNNEIGDMCENTSTFPVSPYVNGIAQQYWSNSAGACVTGFATSTAPVVTSIGVCGRGRDMEFTLDGTFGSAPWDLTGNAFGGQTLYVSALITDPTGVRGPWTAGNPIGIPPLVGFKSVAWTKGGGPGGSDRITVRGFNGAYGAPAFTVHAGDSILFTITNPDNGATTTASVIAPVPARLQVSAAPDMDAGATGNISVTAIDAGNCGVEGAAVSLSNSAGVPMNTITTDATGSASSAGFAYPAVAGAVTFTAKTPGTTGTLSASTTTRVHPRLDAIVQPRGSVAGGQSVVLSGVGFDITMVVAFGGSHATVATVTPDHKKVTVITPPATPAGATGTVGVTATVHGVDSSPVQYDYILADVPVMEFLGGAGSVGATHSCATGRIRVSAFTASGVLESASIALSASYPALFRGLQLVNSLTVSSGATVTISGGGPITATNTSAKNASATQSFPVWPAGLCDAIKAINLKFAHLVAIKTGPWTATEPPCAGDCGTPGTQTVIWSDGPELARARSSLSMQGPDGAALKQRVQVTTLGENAERGLIAQHPALAVRSTTADSASLAGPMIEIRAPADKAATARLPGPAQLTFAAPVAAGPGTYAIVHLRPAGEALAWIEDKPTVSGRDGTVLMTEIDSAGVYALVRLTKAGQRAPAR